MEELQLQLLQKAEAALPPMNSMNPENRLDPIVARPPPRRGKDIRAPIASRIGRFAYIEDVPIFVR